MLNQRRLTVGNTLYAHTTVGDPSRLLGELDKPLPNMLTVMMK
jgi:hypothetical protein